jgi:hypothetical protein
MSPSVRACVLCIHVLVLTNSLSSLPPSLRQPDDGRIHDFTHSTLPRLSPLPHKVQQSIYAFTHALPRFGIPESVEPCEDGTGRGEEDS